MLIEQIEVWNETFVKIQCPYLLSFREISRLKALQSSRVRSGRFNVLNDSASAKIVLKIYFHFFPIFFMGFRAF